VNELFGVSMTLIMVVLLAIFAVCVLAFAGIFVSSRAMFKMGLRNIRRRKSQTVLVVSGLMLATVIITAAFTVGDTVDYSITKETYDNLQRTDLSLHHFRPGPTANGVEEGYVPESFTAQIEGAFANDPDIEGFIPFLFEALPALNPGSQQAEPFVLVAGIDVERLERFGGLTLVSGGSADLAGLGERQTFITQTTANKLNAATGDTIVVFSQDGQWPLEVAGVVRDERSAGTLQFGGLPFPAMAVLLPTMQEMVERPGQINSVSVSLYGDVRSSLERSEPAAQRLEAFQQDLAAKEAAGIGDVVFQVEENKRDAVEIAKLVGSLFTTLFIVLGSFSIAAGIVLIFTLFVMLAAERRTEMGIARAVGAQRSHLMQMFVAEGMVYDVLAGIVGVAIGVFAGLVLVVGGIQLVAGDELGFVGRHVTARSLVVSFTLGAVITFVTVVVSSLRVSLLTIVAAVRGQADAGGQRVRRRETKWWWVVASVPAMVVPPLGLWWLLRKGFGIPWAWIAGPAGFVLGALMFWVGLASSQAFPFTLGVSLLILATAWGARMLGVAARLTWSIAGLLLALYWLMPADAHESLFGEMDGNIEMFVVSGIFIVTSMTMVVVFNARVLSTLFGPRGNQSRYRIPALLGAAMALFAAAGMVFGDVMDGLGQLAYIGAVFFGMFALLSLASAKVGWFSPAIKMGIAYPLANRFRTGMTVVMFSLVVFSITVMGIINASFMQIFGTEEARAGWDIYATTNPNNPIADLREALAAEGSFDTAAITAIGRTTGYDDNVQQVRQNEGNEWTAFPIRTGDDAFYLDGDITLEARAAAYADDRAVIEAVRTQPGLALLDSASLQPQGLGGEMVFTVRGVRIVDGTIEPFTIQISDAVTGRTVEVTVIGVLSARIPATLMSGVYVSEAQYLELFGKADYTLHYLRLADGVNTEEAATAIEAALVTRGVQAISIPGMIEDMMAMGRGFLRVFQAFMGMGLIVGIAALGVIALRSVVERRQQIGMLRAIGYQRATVAVSFMLESGFIALTGIAIGVVGGAILSWSILGSQFVANTSDVPFFLPWSEIIAFSLIAFFFALAMTWWPSQRASSVAVAEALRYE
jgi:putative ABC transport system permease protein